ncbi:MAG TPA: hypothetical protein VM532_06085 [Burkholderiales bacterium]|nr:hypothetical protein [Burkholderiales bacterium]
MPTSDGKPIDDLNNIQALISKLGSAHQHYIAARTAIRDYVINVDENRYTDVERQVAVALEELGQAEVVGGEAARDTIRELLDSVRAWGVIAHQVRDAFASYQETVQNKIVANFATLSESGNKLVRLNALVMTGVLMDLQAAHAAVTGYLNSGQDTLLSSANSAIRSAKTRINQADRTDNDWRTKLDAFSVSFDAYAESLRKAVAYREKAHQLFNDELAPLGARTQASIEHFRQENIEKLTKKP